MSDGGVGNSGTGEALELVSWWVAQSTLLDLIGSKRRVAVIVETEWDETLHAFATDLDQ